MSKEGHQALALVASIGFMVASMAGCASQNGGGSAADGMQVNDPRGDGQPDIVSVTLTQSKSKGAVVRVSVAGVRPRGRFSDGLRLYVDPVGRDEERFIHESTLNDHPFPYEPRIFDGWGPEDLVYQRPPAPFLTACIPSQRNLRPEPTARIVELEFPRDQLFRCTAIGTHRADRHDEDQHQRHPVVGWRRLVAGATHHVPGPAVLSRRRDLIPHRRRKPTPYGGPRRRRATHKSRWAQGAGRSRCP